MTTKRRQSDVEIAVLTEKVDALAKHLLKHMEDEEEERRNIWRELTKLDRKLVIFFTLILTTAGGPNVAQFAQYMM